MTSVRRKGGLREGNKHCCYGTCKSDSRYNYDRLFFFIPFPRPCTTFRNDLLTQPYELHKQDCRRCKKCEVWLRLCHPKFGCDMKYMTKQPHICSLHFVGGNGPTADHPEPVQHVEKRQVADTDPLCTTLDPETEYVFVINPDTQTEDSNSTRRKKSTHQKTQTVLNHYKRRLNAYKKKCVDLKSKLTSPVRRFEEQIKASDKKCKFYTGLQYCQFQALMALLGPAVDNLNFWEAQPGNDLLRKVERKLTPSQELMIVLMRLRRGFLVTDLAYRFRLSTSHVTSLTITWIQLMYLEFGRLRSDMFPSRTKISQTLPEEFKNLKNIRVLVDCAKFFCDSPDNVKGDFFSHLKASTAVKVLFGCTPNGAISFVSEAYDGSVSHRDIFRQSGIVDLLENGDLVLADGGFDVNDLVESRGAYLNKPPFPKERSKEEMDTDNIAKLTIFVKHVVARVKQFRLLNKVLPLNMREMMSQTVFVCACLTNFKPPILYDS